MTIRSILARIVWCIGFALVLGAGGIGLLYGALTDPRPVK